MKYLLSGIVLLFAMLLSTQSIASISLSATRVIIKESQKESAVTVRNEGDDILIQSWIESGSESATQNTSLLAVTPTLVKVDRGAQQIVRILYQGQGLPEDRESMFWLNVQEIPRKAEGENVLTLALRQRIKVFFRPKGLNPDVTRLVSSLIWARSNNRVTVSNPSQYYANIVGITSGKKPVQDVLLVPPKGEAHFDMNTAVDSLNFRIVNDFGGYDSYQASLISR